MLKKLLVVGVLSSVLVLPALRASAEDFAPLGDNTNYVVKDGKLNARGRVLTNGAKTIVLIPMVHISTRKFYKGVGHVLSQYPADSTVVLEEGVSLCGPKGDPQHVLWEPTDKFDAAEASRLYSSAEQPTDEELERAGFAQVDCEKMRGPGFFGRLKERYFSTYSLIGFLFRLHSQMNASGLYPKSMPVRDGDIIGAHLKTAKDQMVFNSLVSCFEAFVGTPTGGRCGRVVKWLKSSIDTESYIVGLRNQVLMAKVLRSLGLEPADTSVDARYEFNIADLGKRPRDTAILAWGAQHFVENNGAFPQALADQGFGYQSEFDVEIASCSRVRRNPVLAATSDNVCR